MGLVITIANQKGGVGKTLTATCMAAILTEQKYKVLTISLDPQRNFDMVAGEGVAIKRDDIDTVSILHVLRGSHTITDAIITTQLGDLARASSQLYQWTGEQTISQDEYLPLRDNHEALVAFLDNRVLQNGNGTKVLSERLKDIKDSYDFILIDTNPSLTLLTLNSLCAADYVIIPAFSEETSTNAIAELWDTIGTLNYFDPWHKIKVLGILMTRCNYRSIAFSHHTRVFKAIADQIGTRLFNTKIRQSARGSDYAEYGVDLIHLDPRGKTSEDYRAFIEEFKEAIREEEDKK